MSSPLIHDRWRRSTLGAIGAAVAVVALLAVLVFHTSTNRFDTWATDEATAHIGSRGRSALFHLVTPAIWFWLLVAVVVGAALAGRRDLGVVAVVAPIVSLAITHFVLKPGIDRTHFGGLAFPSGHETGVSSAALVLFLVTCQLPFRGWARAGIAGVLVAWVVLAAIGLVRNLDHYASDTVAAVAVSTAVVLSTALAVDRWLPHRR